VGNDNLLLVQEVRKFKVQSLLLIERARESGGQFRLVLALNFNFQKVNLNSSFYSLFPAMGRYSFVSTGIAQVSSSQAARANSKCVSNDYQMLCAAANIIIM